MLPTWFPVYLQYEARYIIKTIIIAYREERDYEYLTE